MPAAERRRRMLALRRRVTLRDRDWWAETFMRDLAGGAAVEERRQFTAAGTLESRARALAARRSNAAPAPRVIDWPGRIA
jgi:trehalose-6-phosphate synthase